MSDLDGLPAAVREEIERFRTHFGTDPLAYVIGQHPAIVASRETMRVIDRMPVGSRPPALLVTGEPGTGKSGTANTFRLVGPRQKGVGDIDLAGLSASTIETTLFGASGRGGSLNLREGIALIERVDLLPESLQERLRHAIADVPTGAWVISTTEVDLEQLAQRGHFSRRLYEALRGMSITLPPLRDRGFDVLLMAEHFIAVHCLVHDRDPDSLRLEPSAIDALLRHSWPGNVTELEAVLHRSFEARPSARISAADLGL